MNEVMSISVIIATYNRATWLEACLAALRNQHYSEGDEVIVVDNGSSDDTAEVMKAASRRYPAPLILLEEPRPGKVHALAKGIACSHGETLAFTDDDVIAEKGWLEGIRRALGDGRADLAGGRVLPLWEATPPSWLNLEGNAGGFNRLASPIALLDYGNATMPLGPRTVLGANMAVSRKAFDAAGGFPRQLGKLRGTLLSGEDQELCRRVQAAGFRAVYEPSIVVRHRVPPDRLKLTYYLKWFYWSGITQAALDSSNRGGQELTSRRRLRLYPLRQVATGVARGIVAGALGRFPSAAEAFTMAAFGVGYLAQGKRYAARPEVAEP